MPQIIKLMKSTFYKEFETKQKLANFITRSDILSMNSECKRFEDSFAKEQKRKYAVFVNSGSSANLIILQALLNLGDLKKGDRVGFSALTWATNVMPILQLGLVPVPIDCSIETLNTSPAILNGKVNNLKAFFITNVLGFSDDIKKIVKICKDNNVILLEDNCESLGSEVSGVKLGNFGIASTFSFFVGHHLSTIEGGMVCTNDKSLADMLIMTRAHGWDRNVDIKKQIELRKTNKVDDFYAKYTFYDLAYGVRPTEISGFIGNIQLKFLPVIIKKRQDNFNKFHKAILNNKDFIPLNLGHMNIVSNFSMPVICRTKEICEKYKNKFARIAEIRPIIAGDITKQPFYKKYQIDSNDLPCPNASFVHENGFYFPNNPELTKEDVDSLCKLLS